MPLTANEAWSLVDNASESLKSCQLLSARKQGNIAHALRVLKESKPEVINPYGTCSPKLHKRRKFHVFLRSVLQTCGPHEVLVAAMALTQTTVSGMTNDNRDALCRRLASHENWQPPINSRLQSFLTQFEELRDVSGAYLRPKFDNAADCPCMPIVQETKDIERARRDKAELMHVGGHSTDHDVEREQSWDTIQSAGQTMSPTVTNSAGRCVHEPSSTTCNSNGACRELGQVEPQHFPTLVSDDPEESEHHCSHGASKEGEDLVHGAVRALDMIGQENICQGSVTKTSRAPSTTMTRHIVWVGIPAGHETMKHNPYLHVPVCFKDLEIFEEATSPFQVVDKDLVDDLKAKLGPRFIEYDNDTTRNVVFIHQSVLMILVAAHLARATVEFCNWESEQDSPIQRVLACKHDHVLLFVSDTSCDETTEDLYRATDYLEAVKANFTVFPKKSEWSWCQQKIGDIRQLDDIARQSEAWRPKTCFGKGECALTQPQSGKMVLKRSHSCAGKEVRVVAMTSRDKLLCKAPVPDQAAKRVTRSRCQGVRACRFLYFHQEYVQTFRRTGEFRVWVCGGRVVCAFRTKDDENLPGKPMALRQLDVNDYSDFNWYSSDTSTRKAKYDELLQFVLDIDCRIRRLGYDKFDTVQIGARYDCGISTDHRFYVNELTRFTNADTFSGLLAPPHDQIIGPLAKMIAQELLA